MNKNQAAAYINSQTACANIEAIAMQQANFQALAEGKEVLYKPKDFTDLIEKYGIHHNAVHGYLFVISED